MNSSSRFFLKFVKEYRLKDGLIRFRARVPDGIGGREEKSGFHSKSEAIAWSQARWVKSRSGSNGLSESEWTRRDFVSFCEFWSQSTEANLAFATACRYQSELKNRIFPFFGTYKMKEISYQDVLKFREHLLSSQGAGKTKNMCLQLLKQIVRFYFKTLGKNAFDLELIDGIRSTKRRPAFWGELEIKKFCSLVVDSEDRKFFQIVKIALFTGLRVGELSALSLDDLRESITDGLVHQSLLVSKSQCQKSGQIKSTKTESSRKVPIPGFLVPDIKELLSSKNVLSVLDQKRVSKDLKKFCVKYKLPVIRFHDLRHTWGTFVSTTGHPDLARKILGHTNLSMTSRYVHADDASTLRDFSRIESRVCEILPIAQFHREKTGKLGENSA